MAATATSAATAKPSATGSVHRPHGDDMGMMSRLPLLRGRICAAGGRNGGLVNYDPVEPRNPCDRFATSI
jgi:hypothetical protein